ncbi:MAG TPA: transcriptional regulator [Alphaproteobacteria bacterium]|jgi:DNA-binding winged helix-turn-helix (wHTH) protein|nr:transcriptional regulator [Alphaproteobacteria bacterium]
MLQSGTAPSDRADTDRSSRSPSFEPDCPAERSGALSFGGFRVFPRERLLFDSGAPLRIGDRALDILIALIQRQGQIVSKCDLLEAVWPGLCVDEGTLRVHILALRRILGDGQGGRRFIVTIIGRGYAFVGRVAVKT